MHKKIIMACMAIAAFAAFVAPSASATNLKENGTTLAAGASVKGVNTEAIVFGAGELTTTCTKATLSGTIKVDAGGIIEGTIPAGNPSFTGTGTSGDCTSPLGSVKPTVNSELCLRVANSDTGTVTGCKIEGVEKPVTFTLNVTGIVTCTYQAASISGAITTSTTGDAQVTLTKAGATRDTGNTFFCPASGTLTMKFTLTTTDGTTLLFTT